MLALGALFALVPASAAESKVVWLCKPGLKSNPCDPALRTTYYRVADEQRVGTPKPPRSQGFDCFYVYPTVSDDKRALADRSIDPELRSIALYQAARYSQHCRVFAPVYRQVTLQSLLSGGVPNLQSPIPYGDVRAAFRTYLRKWGRGRGVVLIGHSQGTYVLRKLIADEIDTNRRLRGKLISAVLLGGNVTNRDFKRIPVCRRATQTACVIAFSAFNEPVPENAIFGRAPGGSKVVCTNPAALGGGSAPITSIYPSEPFAPGTTIGAATGALGVTQPQPPTPWAEIAGAYTARCSSAGGASVLQIGARPGAQSFKAVPDATWGLHLADANLGLGRPRVAGAPAGRGLGPARREVAPRGGGLDREALGRVAGLRREAYRLQCGTEVAAPLERDDLAVAKGPGVGFVLRQLRAAVPSSRVEGDDGHHGVAGREDIMELVLGSLERVGQRLERRHDPGGAASGAGVDRLRRVDPHGLAVEHLEQLAWPQIHRT